MSDIILIACISYADTGREHITKDADKIKLAEYINERYACTNCDSVGSTTCPHCFGINEDDNVLCILCEDTNKVICPYCDGNGHYLEFRWRVSLFEGTKEDLKNAIESNIHSSFYLASYCKELDIGDYI